MGCRDDGQAADEARKAIHALKNTLDERTKMLCEVMGLLESTSQPIGIGDLSCALRRWWDDHKTADAKRQQAEYETREKLRRQADLRAAGSAKLTPEERKALGI